LQETLLTLLKQQVFPENFLAPHDYPETKELLKVQMEMETSTCYLRSLYESLERKIITEAEFVGMKTGYERSIATLTAQKDELKGTIRARTVKNTNLSEASSIIRSLRDFSDLTADVVSKLVEKVLVYEDKTFSVKFSFSDETFSSKEAGNRE
jgi:hypothetical protein